MNVTALELFKMYVALGENILTTIPKVAEGPVAAYSLFELSMIRLKLQNILKGILQIDKEQISLELDDESIKILRELPDPQGF